MTPNLKPIKLWMIDLEAGILEASEEEKIKERLEIEPDEDESEDEE